MRVLVGRHEAQAPLRHLVKIENGKFGERIVLVLEPSGQMLSLNKTSVGNPWILEPSATGLCKPDLHVFAKLFEDRLERGLEAQAFSGREIGGDNDVLDFFVGHLVDVDLTRQPAA